MLHVSIAKEARFGTMSANRRQMQRRKDAVDVRKRAPANKRQRACRALKQGGKSLLAVGIREVRGDFEPGELVGLHTGAGVELGRGLANYSSQDLQRIHGCRSEQIQASLGHVPYSEVIHRDNLALTGK